LSGNYNIHNEAYYVASNMTFITFEICWNCL